MRITIQPRSVLRVLQLVRMAYAPLMKERVLLLPLIGDEKLCDGLSEVQLVAVVLCKLMIHLSLSVTLTQIRHFERGISTCRELVSCELHAVLGCLVPIPLEHLLSRS